MAAIWPDVILACSEELRGFILMRTLYVLNVNI